MISSSATNNLILDQNRKISNLTLSSKTIDLNGYSLTVYGTATMTSGTVTNGTFYARGTLAAFNGTLMDCPVDADCGYIRFSGSTFNSTVTATDQGVATGTGAGGCTFNDDVTIIHGGNGTYFTLANTTGDVFNADLTVINYSSHEVHLSNTSTTQYKGNIILNSTGTGGITFGNSGGTSTLDSGKTITIGSTGFTNDVLLIKNFTQLGNTAQTLTLSGTAVVSFNGSTFNGEITVSSPGILLKNSTFNGMSSFTKTGTSNAQSDGGNVFNYATTISNTAASGRIRMATVSGDTYNADVTFNSTGQDVQIAYSGDNTFAGNITINSNKVVFNTSTGKVTFTGTNNQTLNGSYNYPFKKLAINKSAGTITANTTLSVDDSLIFIQGNLITTSTNLLTMKHGSTANGASNSSFVSGPVKKVGNSAFVFDVGSGNTYRPLTITAPTNTSDAFTAEYYNAGQTLGSTKDTTITFVSDCGYWKLDRNVGSSNITPKFAFDSLHCDYLTVKLVHIALWNGTKWTDKGEAVTESTNKTTSSAMSSYGYFAFAYDLKPGDAPQMPYPLTIGSSCSTVELQFTSNDIWFSFTPDSAVVKGSFTSPDTSKTYAFIKSAAIYEAYQVGDTLQSVSIKTWPFDSMLVNFQNYVADLTPDTDYLLKISKFDVTEGSGIYDSIDYYINMCLFNLRMQMSPTFRCYSDLTELVAILGTVANPNGLTRGGDVVLPCASVSPIDLTTLTSPLLVEEGVTFCGNYDLLSESFDVSIPGETRTITTSPTGTLITNQRRGEVISQELNEAGYSIYMMPYALVRNIRFEGAMPGFQDYNFDINLCAGIRTQLGTTNGPFHITNCEFYNFSYAGIFILVRSDDVIINNCYNHHINGAGGFTTAKGYGIWAQGNVATLDPVTYAIRNTIFEDSKEGIDVSPNPTNATIEYCTFGDFFGNENINRHLFNSASYYHPVSLSWTPPTNCFYNQEHGTGCSSSNESLATMFEINRLSAGNISINHSVFHQAAMNISLGYPHNPKDSLKPLFNIDITQNTFAHKQDFPGTYNSSCGLGGYARIDNINVEECTWDYERNHNILGQYLFTTPSPLDTKPILTHSPNAFSYTPGTVVNNSTSPQPPEVEVTFDAINYVPGFSPNTSAIPFYSLNDNIEVSLSHGITGSQSQNVTYIVRAKVNEGGASGSNASGNNAYNNSQYVTLPQTSVQTVTNTQLNWTTDKPGLYGIDAYAVDGNYTSTSSSTYLTSKLVHNPVIIEPATNYILTFNIKDSYYSQLNATSGLTGVKKQVELNGNVIWQEDISQGGDDWEYVMINIDADTYTPPGSSPVSIKSYLNGAGFQNEITFSIAIANPGSVNTSGSTNLLRGVRVWVDDIYLKKYDSAQNLITDGDVENSEASELTGTSTTECIWYRKNQVTFEAYHLDDTENDLPPANPAKYATTKANLSSVERKSGFRAIQLDLPPLKFAGAVAIASNYGVLLPPSSPGANGEFISAAVNFDIRDFYDCEDVAVILDYTPTPSMPTSAVSDEKLLVESSWLVTSSLTIANSDLLFKSTSTPINITVANGGTLTITGNQTDLTYMGGCKMWDGIKVEPGGILIIDGMWVTTATAGKFVKIEDAITAVSGIGNGTATDVPQVYLNNIAFNKNIVALHFENDNFSSSSVLRCLFKCDGGFISKDASNPIIIPKKHIYIESATNLTIGGGGQACIFQDVLVGIEASKSDVITYLCEFNNLMDISNFPAKGYGIVATNVDPTPRVMDVSRTRFFNLQQGISTTGNYNINIDNDNIDYFRDVDDIAISLNCMNYNNDIDIRENKEFLKCNIGIKISGSNLNEVTIADNTFNNTGFVETQTNSFHNTAITVQMPFTTARLSTNVEIIGNSITDYRIGIHARNIYNISIGSNPTTNSPNIITFSQNSFDDHHRGIWVENSNGAKIQDNEIHQTSTATPSGSYTVEGITIDNCKNAVLTSNELFEFYSPIRLKGSCIGSELHCNTIDNSIYESGNGVNVDGADVSPQGVDLPGTSLDETWDNKWIGYSNTVNGIVGIPGQPFNWYFDSGLLNGEPFPAPGSANPISLNPDNSDFCILNLAPPVHERDRQFGKIAEDSLEYVNYEEVFKYNNKQHLYQLIDADTTLLTLSTSKDTSFRAFYDRTKQSNIKLFDIVDSLISVNSLDASGDLNNAINDTTTIESNLKIIYGFLINKLFRDSILNSADSSAIEAVATQHSLEGGFGVFWARSLLFLEIHDNSASSRIGQTTNAEFQINSLKETPIELILMPNPADDECTIKVNGAENDCYLSINNMLGENVFVKKIENGSNSIILNTKFLQPGVYLVSVTNGNTFLKNAKLIISR